jgi:hypothetical protein
MIKNHRLEFKCGMSVEETSLAAWRMAIKTEASQRD